MVEVDLTRVVEVWNAAGRKIGSGFLISDRHVLTAKHVVQPAAMSGEMEVRLFRPSTTPPDAGNGWTPALLEWVAAENDLAVLTVTDLPRPPTSTAPRWGRIQGGAPVPVVAVGFPDASTRDGRRDTWSIRGTVDPHHEARAFVAGTATIHNVEGITPRRGTARSPWSGASGAAVFARATGHLLGIITADHAIADTASVLHMTLIEPNADLADAVGARVEVVSGAAFAAPIAVEGGPGFVVPRQLPHAGGDFTGRRVEVETLRQYLDSALTDGSITLTISALGGKAGLGKTALATYVGHLVQERFADGQLYVNLRGVEPREQSRQPSDVLAEFLRALGVDASLIPTSEDERASLYRSRLAGKRILVVLDNAADTAQVRPLLPGGSPAAVIITSRTPLTGLEGAKSIQLPLMEEEDCIDLLRVLISPDRVGAEHQEALRIVTFCGRLPLAVRICGAILTVNPRWRLTRLCALLEDERRRLGVLKTGDLDVRASFNLSYRNGGSPGDQRAFRLLGLIGAADFAAWIIGPLLGVGPDEAEAVGMRLESAQLIETVAESPSGELRYRFHDLLRALAREHLADDEDYEQQRGAVERFARACAELAAYALDLYEPSAPESVGQSGAAIADTREGEAVRAHPTRWFADEVSNLVDAVVLAENFELWDLTWQICRALIPLLEVSSLWVEWAQVNELGLKAARQAGDGHAEAVMLRWRGELHRYQGDHDGAIHDLRRCIGIFRQRNESANQAGALIRLGEMRRYLGETAAGLDCMTKAKHIYLDQGHELGVAYALTRIGGIHRVVGQINDAIAEFLEALPILLEHGHRREAAIVLISLGDVYHLKAQWTDAMGCFERCGELFHSLGDAMWEANTARHIGVVDTILGRRADARRRFDEALKVFRLIGDDRKQALTLWNLGELLADENRLDEAMSAFESARRIFERIRNPFNVTTVLISIAWAQARYGDLDEAESWVRRSLAAAESHGTDVLLATAQLNVAQLYVRSGRCSQGRAIAQASLDVHRRMGSLRWEPAALEIIAESVRLQEHS